MSRIDLALVRPRKRLVTITLTEVQRRMLRYLARDAKERVERLPELNENQLLYIADLEATIQVLDGETP